ncbi:MAG: hypothetical protein ACWA47_12105 [Brevirhabdus sp.]
MGPVRRRLIAAAAAIAPAPAWAQVCTTIRPSWDGTPVSALDEAINLLASPPALVLLLLTALAARFRHQWGALIVVLLWTGYATLLTMIDPGGTRTAAMAEGCIGTPTLFIAAVAAISVATIIYTAPRPKGP